MKALPKKWWWQSSFFILFFLSGLIKAQPFVNLVPNGSFETYTQCPNNSSQVYFAPPWTGPTTNSSDYLNACSQSMNAPHYGGVGSFYPYYLEAKDGQAYAGIQIYNNSDYREYLQVGLTDTLEGNICYFIEFYATNIQRATHAVNNIAANLSAISYPLNLTNTNSLLNVPAHVTNYGNTIVKDTVKWDKISGIYEASGSEKYLTIGNFKNAVNTDTFRIYALGTGPIFFANVAYIFVDAVSVYSLDPHGSLPWAYKDTIINPGESVYIGNKMGGLNFHPQWFDASGTYLSTNAGITVSPTVTSNYIVQFTLCGVPRKDTVTVTVRPEITVGLNNFSKLKEQLEIYPVPANDFIELKVSNAELVKDFKSIRIYNNLGKLIREEEILFSEKKIKIKTNDLEEGVYSIQLSGNKQTINKRFVVSH